MEAELQRAIEESKKNAEGFGGFGMDHINQYPPGVQQVFFEVILKRLNFYI